MALKKIINHFNLRRDESKTSCISRTEEVCVFPLPNMVLFPGVVLPLHIFEERYKKMMQDLIKTRMPLAMSWGRHLPNGDLQPNPICGAGRMGVLQDYPDGRKDVFVEASKRLEIVDFVQLKPYIKAIAKPILDIPFDSPQEETEYLKELSMLAKRWVFLTPDLHDHLMQYITLFHRPHHLADFIGFYFLPSTIEKQLLLETLERKKRVIKVMQFLQLQVTRLENQDMSRLVRRIGESKELH